MGDVAGKRGFCLKDRLWEQMTEASGSQRAGGLALGGGGGGGEALKPGAVAQGTGV